MSAFSPYFWYRPAYFTTGTMAEGAASEVTPIFSGMSADGLGEGLAAAAALAEPPALAGFAAEADVAGALDGEDGAAGAAWPPQAASKVTSRSGVRRL